MVRCNVALDKSKAGDVVIIVIDLVCGMSFMKGSDCGMKPPTVSIAYLKSDVRDEALRSIFGDAEEDNHNDDGDGDGNGGGGGDDDDDDGDNVLLHCYLQL
ncbi:hypothetical protein INT46_005881 [Mucor plumbeus]|uniref:Uncharacterized protein n=1 Tax=Mucor plumbeus TaxID=97098 RepID=A0A8H7R7W1_9FUNG|nr:hypothetical protein INT46_005881 [Mucor plumbeus]